MSRRKAGEKGEEGRCKHSLEFWSAVLRRQVTQNLIHRQSCREWKSGKRANGRTGRLVSSSAEYGRGTALHRV